MYQQLDSAQHEGTGFILDDLDLPPDLLAEVSRDRDAGGHPSKRPGLDHAIETLLSLSLLAVAPGDADADPHYLVHRWTARGLQYLIRDGMAPLVDAANLSRRTAGPPTITKWRAASRREALADLWRPGITGGSGEPGRAAAVTLRACAIMIRWGEHQQIRQLCEQALADIPETDRLACELLHMQSKAEQALGQFGIAEALARASLDIAEANGSARWKPSGMSNSPRWPPLAPATSQRGALTTARSPSPARPGTPSWKSAATWDSAPWRWPLAATTRLPASARRPGTTRGRRPASTPSWKGSRSSRRWRWRSVAGDGRPAHGGRCRAPPGRGRPGVDHRPELAAARPTAPAPR